MQPTDKPSDSESLVEGRTQADYGSCAVEDPVAAVLEKSDPLKILIRALAELAPVAGPLIALLAFTVKAPKLNMRCKDHPIPVVEAACVWTKPAVSMFAPWGLVLSLSLMSWRIMYERTFYLLLRHKIMVDYEDSVQGLCVTLFLALLYTVALIHFALMLTFDHPTGKPDENFLNTPISTLWQDPEVFMNKNSELMAMVAIMVAKFIAPGGVCLGFIAGYDSLEEKLLSLSKYIEEDPHKSYRILGETTFVPESVIREIVINCESKLEFGGKWKIEELCHKVSELALTYDGVATIGQAAGIAKPTPAKSLGPDPEAIDANADVELNANAEVDRQASPGRYVKEGPNRIWKAVKQTFLMDWWPVKLLLDVDLTDDDSNSFAKTVGFAFLATHICAVVAVLRTLRRIYNVAIWTYVDQSLNPRESLSESIPLLVACYCFSVAVRSSWKYSPCGRRQSTDEPSSREMDAVGPDSNAVVEAEKEEEEEEMDHIHIHETA